MPGILAKIASLALPRSRTAQVLATTPTRRSAGERHLLVDVSVMCQDDARTGIQRVVRGVLLQLLSMRLDGYVVRPVFATPRQSYHYLSVDLVPRDGVRFGPDGGATDVQDGDIFLGLDLAAHILPAHLAMLRHWKAKGATIAIVIYDLLPVVQPRWFNDRMVRHFRRWLSVIDDHADSVLCISAHVAQDFRNWIAAQPAMNTRSIAVHHVPLGHDIAATAPSRGIPVNGERMLSTICAAPAMLMVGTIEPRKGYDVALAAFEQLWAQAPDSPYTLVIVGKPGWKTADLQARLRNHPKNGTHLFWFEHASDEYLGRLYRACTAVLVASHTEGFGLPIIEAQGYGKPVLVRDAPVFRELEQGTAVYFQDDKALPLSDAIRAMLSGNHPQIDRPDRIVQLNSTRQPVTWSDAAAHWLVALGVREIGSTSADSMLGQRTRYQKRFEDE